MKGQTLFYHIMQIFLLILILLLGVSAYRTVSTRTMALVEQIKTDMIGKIETQFAVRLKYAGISPSFLNSVILEDLNVYSRGESEPFLHIDRVKLNHNLIGFLFSQDTVLTSISASGVHLDLDLSHDREFFDRVSSSGQGGDRFLDLNRVFTKFIRIRNWDAQFRSDLMTVEGSGNNLSLRQLGEYLRVNLKGHLSYQTMNDEATLKYLTLDAELKGTIQNDLTAFALDSEFSDIDTNLAVLENQRLNIGYRNEQFRLTKIKDNKPYDLNLQLSSEEIKLTLIADEFSPSRLVLFKSSLEQMNPWLNTSFSGQGEFVMKRDTGFIQYFYKGSAAMDNSLLPFPLQINLDIQGDDLHLRSEKLLVSTVHGAVDWRGQWVFSNGYPEGSLFINNLFVGEDKRLNGQLVLRNIDDYYSINSKNIRLNKGSETGNLKALVYRENESFIFSLQSDLNPENDRSDRLVLDGEISFDQEFQIQSSFRITDMLLSSISPFLGLPVLDTILTSYPDIQIQSEGTFSYSKDDLMVQISRLKGFLPDENRSLTLSGFFDNDTLDLYSLEMIWDQNYLLGSGKTWLQGNQITMESRWDLNDNKYEFNGLYRNGQFSLLGNYGVKIQLAEKAQSGYLGTLETTNIPLSWNGQDLIASLNLRGRYTRDNWEFFLSESRVQWLNSDFLKKPELSMTAFLAPGAVNIFSLGYSDEFSTLTGNGSFFYDIPNGIYNSSLLLKDDSTGSVNESYDAFAAYNDGSLSLTMQIDQGMLDRFSFLDMKGRFDSTINFQGAFDSPQIEGIISAPGLEWHQNPFGVEGKIRLSTEKLEIHDLNIQRNNLYLTRGLGVFDLKDGSLVFTTALSNADSGGEKDSPFSLIETGLTVKADTGLSIDFKNFEVPVLTDYSGRLRIHPIKWNGLTSFASKTIEFSKKGPLIHGELLGDQQQFVHYNSETYDIEANLNQGFPVSFHLEGNLSPEALNLKVNDLLLDLNVINYFMPKDPTLKNRYVVFLEGSRMEGRMNIQGTLTDPDFSGSLTSKDLFLLTPYTDADIGEVHLDFQIKDDIVTAPEFTIPVGKGALRGQGQMTMRGWGINDYNLDIRAEGSPGAPISYNAHGLNGTGAFTGQFKLHGDSSQGNFDGIVVVNELVGSLGDKTDLIIRQKNDSAYPFRLNLVIETGKNVLFVLPNPQVELVRAVAESGEIINLTFDSLNKTMSMTGGVSIRSGEIYYFDRTFQMTQGSLTFNEDENTFNPFLNIEAEIDTNDIQGDNVTIYLVYRNPILNEFTPSFRSNPSMPEDQITALFGQSLIPYGESGEADVSKLILATGGMVSQYGFVRPFEQALKDSMNLDNVTIKTEILENALLDQLNRESTVTDAGSSYSMAKYLDNTSLYLGKFAGDSLYFSAGVVVDYDQLYGLRSYMNGIDLVPDLTIEMRTPFFMVFWNYNKSNAFDIHNTDFVKNNAIGFEWRYSY